MRGARVIGLCVLASGLAAAEAHAAPDLRASDEGFSVFGAYLEVGGPLFASVNVDVRPVRWASLRVGAGPTGFAPLAALLLGRYDHFLEVGGGVTVPGLLVGDDPDSRFYVGTLGYRYQRARGGFLFRATASPIWRADHEERIFLVGLSFGGSH